MEFIFIFGPTGTSKTKQAIKFFEKAPSNTIVISIDSRKMIQHLDIATNKLSLLNYIQTQPKDLQKHFLGINLFSLDQKFNVYSARKLILKEYVNLINTKNLTKTIIFGGSGLYLESFLRPNILNYPPSNKKTQEYLSTLSLKELQDKLVKIAPTVFSNLNNSEKHNKIRLIRKIDVILQSKSAHPPKDNNLETYKTLLAKSIKKLLLINPNLDKSTLKTNLKKRIDKMFNQGLIQEFLNILQTHSLEEQPYNLTPINLNIMGYKQLINLLKHYYPNKYPNHSQALKTLKEPANLKKLKQEILKAHYKYAKYQISWSKRYINNPLPAVTTQTIDPFLD